MYYLSHTSASYCRDYVVQFYKHTRHGTESIAETKVRCASDAAALRIARYELGSVCADAWGWARPATN